MLLSQCLKVLANSTSYSILAEFQRHEINDPVGVSVYSDCDSFATTTMTPEDPGPSAGPEQVTASGPNVLRWFSSYNAGRRYEEQIKPANVLLLAQPDPLACN
jgi:hypothetical protein